MDIRADPALAEGRMKPREFIGPQAWLADVLARIAAHPAHRIDELLPWNWRKDKKDAPALAT